VGAHALAAAVAAVAPDAVMLADADAPAVLAGEKGPAVLAGAPAVLAGAFLPLQLKDALRRHVQRSVQAMFSPPSSSCTSD
jgi:hypothetical protein